MNDEKVTSIRVTEKNLGHLRIIKAIERKKTYNDAIKFLTDLYYENSIKD